MNIRIIKPGQKEYFLNEQDKTTFGGMSEIKGLIKLLKNFSNVEIYNKEHNYDYVCIINSFDRDVDFLKRLNTNKIQIITDLNLIYSKDEIGENKIITQEPGDRFFPLNALCLYYLDFNKENKEYFFGYAGGTRNGNRDKKYIEYLNPKHDYIDWIHTSSKLDIFENSDKVSQKINFEELQNKYKKTLYSIVMADVEYNLKGFLTQRPYELIAAGVIPFVDYEYDKYNLIFSKEYPYRVESSSDIKNIIGQFDNQAKEHNNILLNNTLNYLYGEKITNDLYKLITK